MITSLSNHSHSSRLVSVPPYLLVCLFGVGVTSCGGQRRADGVDFSWSWVSWGLNSGLQARQHVSSPAEPSQPPLLHVLPLTSSFWLSTLFKCRRDVLSLLKPSKASSPHSKMQIQGPCVHQHQLPRLSLNSRSPCTQALC